MAESLMLVSPLLLSLLLLVVHPVVCKKTVMWQDDYFDDLHRINQHIIIRQFQERILNALNRSSSPHFSSTWNISKRRPSLSSLTTSQANLSLIFSQAFDQEHPETVLFKISSHICRRVEDVDSVLLVLSLRSIPEELRKLRSGAHHSRTNATESTQRLISENARLKARLRLCPNRRKENFEENLIRKSKGSLDNGKGHEFASGNASMPLNPQFKRDIRHINQPERWQVKVIVRVINPRNGRKRTIITEECLVGKDLTIMTPMPTKYLTRAASSDDHSLLLQIVCRNCTHRVRLDGIYKKFHPKSLHGKGKHLNANRPFLVIETRNNSGSGL